MLRLLEKTMFSHQGSRKTSIGSQLENKTNEANTYQLRNLASESRSVLLKFKTAFPFDFFPDTITIDENKVNILSRDFLFNYHLRSIVIEDITDVSVDTGLLFATLTIVDSSNYRFPITETIRHIAKSDALQARRLIQGLILAKCNKIDLSNIPLSRARAQLCALGACEENNVDRSTIFTNS